MCNRYFWGSLSSVGNVWSLACLDCRFFGEIVHSYYSFSNTSLCLTFSLFYKWGFLVLYGLVSFSTFNTYFLLC